MRSNPSLSACSPALANGHTSRKKGEGPKEPAQRTEALPLWDGTYENGGTPAGPLPDIGNKPSPNTMSSEKSRGTSVSRQADFLLSGTGRGGRASDHGPKL